MKPMTDDLISAGAAVVRQFHSVPEDHQLAVVESGANALCVRELLSDGTFVREFCVVGLSPRGGGMQCRVTAYDELLTPEQEETLERFWQPWFDTVEKNSPGHRIGAIHIIDIDKVPELFKFVTSNNVYANVLPEMMPVFRRISDRFESLGYYVTLINGKTFGVGLRGR